MANTTRRLISIIVPCYNEAAIIDGFFSKLQAIADANHDNSYEFVYVNDGSRDDSLAYLQQLATTDTRLKLVSFTRNFGKEMATTAGIRAASGDAIIILDADGQHPIELIPEFLAKWQAGAQVVIGVRTNSYQTAFKRLTSKLFYKLFNSHSDTHLIPGSTDFRLIDKAVQQEFITLSEHSRMTRALIDWLGFRKDYVYFEMAERIGGTASYDIGKLIGLALDSFVSLSLRPLYMLAYAGFVSLLLSVILALFSASEMLIGDPLGLRITGTAYLVLLILFLIGMILISQGVLALYVSHIHTETKARPLYIVDREASRGI